MKKRNKRISFLVSLAVLVGMGATPITKVNVEAQAATNNYNLPDDIDDGVILQAWNWSFNTIKEKLPEIAKAGYTAVQTSPIQGTKENSMATANWWVLYQPTNYKIGNAQLGTRDEFKSMCEAAEDYGIKVIVDVVANHTANSASAQYYPDSTVDPDIKNNENYWHEHRGIQSYDDRWQVTHWGIGLPDLNTSNWDLQNKVIDFLNDCIACGADGFRFDAAKHIELPSDPGGSDFWTRVLGSLNRDDLYIYGEVLQGGADNFAAYTQYMDVTASDYGGVIRSAVGYNSSVNLYNTLNYSVPSGIKADKLVTWVESHDNYANDDKVSTYMSDYQIKMGWSIIAARADSSALFLARPAGTTQNSGNMGVVGSTLWEDSVVSEVNKFHNEMVGESEYFRYDGASTVMIERGTKGMVIVNMDNGKDISSDTFMEDGQYKDTISGNVFTVSNGKISGHVNKNSVAVLYHPVENIKVSSNKESCQFVNSIDVVLSATGVNTATYSIDGGSEVEYKNGTPLNLGADKAIGSTTTLTLKGYKGDKIVTQNYSYKKVEKKENAVVYMEKPSSWATPNVYVYDDSSSAVKQVAPWPGVKMTSEGDNLYSYTLPDGWNNAKVIFNDGTNQIPDKQQAGFAINDGQIKIYKNGSFSDYEDKKLTIKSINSSVSSPQAIGNTINISVTAAGGKGTKNYRFAVANDGAEATVLSDYSTNSSVNWIPTEPGTYTITVNVKDDEGTIVSDTMTYVITDNQITKVYFAKPSSWRCANIYVYDDSSSAVKQVAPWPGVKMTSEGDNLYSYTLPEGWSTAKVIFNDGSNQIPGKQQAGYVINNGEIKIYKDGSFSNYEEEKLTLKSIKTSIASPQAAGSTINISAEAAGGKGTKNYRFSVTNDGVNVKVLSDYSTTSNVNWIPTETGTYTISVNVKDDEGTTVSDTMTYVINDEEIAKVYFVKPSSWSCAKIYAYDESGSSVKQVAAWPGVSMVSEGGDLYSYTLPAGWDSANVIFTDGSNQVPACGQTGFYIKLGETKIYQNGNWLDY